MVSGFLCIIYIYMCQTKKRWILRLIRRMIKETFWYSDTHVFIIQNTVGSVSDSLPLQSMLKGFHHAIRIDYGRLQYQSYHFLMIQDLDEITRKKNLSRRYILSYGYSGRIIKWRNTEKIHKSIHQYLIILDMIFSKHTYMIDTRKNICNIRSVTPTRFDET